MVKLTDIRPYNLNDYNCNKALKSGSNKIINNNT
jgi:hypothetical protein